MRFTKGIVGEDNPFNSEILKQVKRIVVAGEAKYNYLQARPGAITSNYISQKKIDSVFWWDTIRRECHERYPKLEPYALRRQVLFYMGLYNTIASSNEYTEVKAVILSFLKEHRKEILHNSINERMIKLSTWMLLFFPELYIVFMRIYKWAVGSMARIND